MSSRVDKNSPCSSTWRIAAKGLVGDGRQVIHRTDPLLESLPRRSALSQPAYHIITATDSCLRGIGAP
jgi:hypothetical protein